mmetsp:Transcript_44617/g.95900  ORF Transcript_44617/g.95900 Transcript_44617/m.95900 type:complete len:296 (-) Transcript_44617:349-1236(-)
MAGDAGTLCPGLHGPILPEVPRAPKPLLEQRGKVVRFLHVPPAPLGLARRSLCVLRRWSLLSGRSSGPRQAHSNLVGLPPLQGHSHQPHRPIRCLSPKAVASTREIVSIGGEAYAQHLCFACLRQSSLPQPERFAEFVGLRKQTTYCRGCKMYSRVQNVGVSSDVHLAAGDGDGRFAGPQGPRLPPSQRRGDPGVAAVRERGSGSGSPGPKAVQDARRAPRCSAGEGAASHSERMLWCCEAAPLGSCHGSQSSVYNEHDRRDPVQVAFRRICSFASGRGCRLLLQRRGQHGSHSS